MTTYRVFREPELVVASHNQGKVREINELLKELPISIQSAAELNLPEPEETGTTFVANAELKARSALEHGKKAAIADDSGFCVEALGGDPGIYSARWAGPERDFSLAMRNVEEKLQAAGARDPNRRRGYFIAVLALIWPDGHIETFEGRVDGTCVWPPRGDKGFGYDPIFVPDGHDRTFGEMSSDEKHSWGKGNALSHRARAFEKLYSACFEPAIKR
ncbi:MAG: RdgB/HAM1 family non-canonical purine NTP pyrophosphatase [Pseudomonadota bacterium]